MLVSWNIKENGLRTERRRLHCDVLCSCRSATVYMSATTSVARSGLRCLLTRQGETAS